MSYASFLTIFLVFIHFSCTMTSHDKTHGSHRHPFMVFHHFYGTWLAQPFAVLDFERRKLAAKMAPRFLLDPCWRNAIFERPKVAEHERRTIRKFLGLGPPTLDKCLDQSWLVSPPVSEKVMKLHITGWTSRAWRTILLLGTSWFVAYPMGEDPPCSHFLPPRTSHWTHDVPIFLVKYPPKKFP